MTTISEELLRSLRSPSRNHYYYGKPLDVRSFQLEQCYGTEKQWLVNRFTLGPGVLCGLRVVLGVDGRVALQRGVAIDGLGREIIVPAAVVVDPAQPTDAQGRPEGEPLTSGFTTIRVRYSECAAEPTAVEVSECDGCTETAPALIRESFTVLVAEGLPPATPPALSAEQRDAIFPVTPPADFDRRVAAESTLGIGDDLPDQPCIVVATVDLGATPRVVDEYSYRPEVFSNTVLFELIAALAERVDACCGGAVPPPPPVTLSLALTGGGNQTGQVGAWLAAPIVFSVSDNLGNPVDAELVEVSTSDTRSGVAEASAAPVAASIVTVTTAGGGLAAVLWQLGSTPGLQTITATLVSSGATVTVTGLAEAAPVVTAPQVRAIRPPNGGTVPDIWANEPVLRLAFDTEMDAGSLADPEPWLRIWWFQNFGQGEFTRLTRIRLELADPGHGSSPTYRGEQVPAERFTVLVAMLGDASIVSAANGVPLDAEFDGTRLAADQVAQIWDADVFDPDQSFVDAVTEGPGILPSGDGPPGGAFFTSFFRLGPVQ